MDFIESDELQMLREAVASIASKFGHEYYVKKAHADERTDELWSAVAEAGFLGVNVPEEYGGGRWRHHRARRRTGGAGRRRMPAAGHRGVAGHLRDHHRQVRHRGPEATVAPRLRQRASSKMAFAITEPDAGSNSHNLALTATKDGDVYRLNGSKYYISGVDECRGRPRGHPLGRRPGHRTGPALAVRRGHRTPGLDKQVLPVEIVAPEKQYTLFFDNAAVTPTGSSVRRVKACAKCSSGSTPSASCPPPPPTGSGGTPWTRRPSTPMGGRCGAPPSGGTRGSPIHWPRPRSRSSSPG